MKRDEGVITIPVRRCACALLLLVAMAALLAPSSLHAGGCMDGKMTAIQDYYWNDTTLKLTKAIEIEYTAVIQPLVKSKVSCSLVSGSTDLKCTITKLHTYIYYIAGDDGATIKNPGWVWQGNNVHEKICSSLRLAVYAHANDKPVY